MAEPLWGNVSVAFKQSIIHVIEAHAKEVAEVSVTQAKQMSELQEKIGRLSADTVLGNSGTQPLALPSGPLVPSSESHDSRERQVSCGSNASQTTRREQKRTLSDKAFVSELSEVDATWYHRGARQRRKAARVSQSSSQVWGSSGSTSVLDSVVHSTPFEIVFAALIFLNAIFIGFQTEYASEAGSDPRFKVVDYAFALLFTVELVMRVVACGCRQYLFSASERGWNYLDVLVVGLSWLEGAIHIAASLSNSADEMVNMSPLRMLRIVRFARFARIVRVGRIFKIVRSFRFLVVAIIHSLQSVFWALVMVFVMIYIFALVLRQATSDIQWDGKTRPQDFEMYWGSLPSSMFTLFKAIAGGLSWHDCVVPLGALNGIWTAVFIFYICFATFAVFNVIIGVFCQNAIEGAQADRGLAVQKQMEMKKTYQASARKLFKEIDLDESNSITLHEFEMHWDTDEAAAFFATMDIEADQAWELFRLLDKDNGGYIDIEEFVDGCLHLNGNATAMHAANLLMMTAGMDSRLSTMRQEQKRQSSEQNKLSASVQALHAELLLLNYGSGDTPSEFPVRTPLGIHGFGATARSIQNSVTTDPCSPRTPRIFVE